MRVGEVRSVKRTADHRESGQVDVLVAVCMAGFLLMLAPAVKIGMWLTVVLRLRQQGIEPNLGLAVRYGGPTAKHLRSYLDPVRASDPWLIAASA
jgi:hypothetical protein